MRKLRVAGGPGSDGRMDQPAQRGRDDDERGLPCRQKPTVVAPVRSVARILTAAPALPEVVCVSTNGPRPIGLQWNGSRWPERNSTP